MRTNYRMAGYVVFLGAMLLAPAMMFAQSPFDGTWRANLDQSKLSTKPNIFSLSSGVYACSSCGPVMHGRADGTDQPVTGHEYDKINVHEVDTKSIAIATKKNGTLITE